MQPQFGITVVVGHVPGQYAGQSRSAKDIPAVLPSSFAAADTTGGNPAFRAQKVSAVDGTTPPAAPGTAGKPPQEAARSMKMRAILRSVLSGLGAVVNLAMAGGLGAATVFVFMNSGFGLPVAALLIALGFAAPMSVASLHNFYESVRVARNCSEINGAIAQIIKKNPKRCLLANPHFVPALVRLHAVGKLTDFVQEVCDGACASTIIGILFEGDAHLERIQAGGLESALALHAVRHPAA